MRLATTEGEPLTRDECLEALTLATINAPWRNWSPYIDAILDAFLETQN